MQGASTLAPRFHGSSQPDRGRGTRSRSTGRCLPICLTSAEISTQNWRGDWEQQLELFSRSCQRLVSSTPPVEIFMRGLKTYPDLPSSFLRHVIRSCFDKDDPEQSSFEQNTARPSVKHDSSYACSYLGVRYSSGNGN